MYQWRKRAFNFVATLGVTIVLVAGGTVANAAPMIHAAPATQSVKVQATGYRCSVSTKPFVIRGANHDKIGKDVITVSQFVINFDVITCWSGTRPVYTWYRPGKIMIKDPRRTYRSEILYLSLVRHIPVPVTGVWWGKVLRNEFKAWPENTMGSSTYACVRVLTTNTSGFKGPVPSGLVCPPRQKNF